MCANVSDDRCDCNTIHEDVVNEVREHMIDDEVFLDLADLFKTFGDSSRVKILYALFKAEIKVRNRAVAIPAKNFFVLCMS